MKLIQKVFSLIGCVFLLSACLGALPGTEEAEPTHLVPSNTVTLTSTSVATFTPGLPSVTPTFTATPTPPPIPTLRFDRFSSTYQLSRPSPEGLLELTSIINTQHGYLRRYKYEDSLSDLMINELSGLLTVIDAETELYYPDGFPHPAVVWNYYPITNDAGYPFFPPAYLEALTNAVFDNLNRELHTLKDQKTIPGKGYAVKSYRVELDHDPGLEWLVRIDWESIAALSWLVLNQNPDQSYTRLKLSLPNVHWVPYTWDERIEILQDFTGDSLTDIIFMEQGYAMGTDFYDFYIAKGTQSGFQKLTSISKTTSVTETAAQDAAYQLEPPPGSQWLSLTVSDPHDINWGCAWDTKTSYRWPYGVEQVSITDKETPRTPECLLARAVNVYDSVDDATAVNLLENAIVHFDQNDSEHRGKLLFARYRLAILYAVMNKDSLSRKHLELLVQNLTGSETYLKENIMSLLEEDTINAITLCDSMYHASETEMPESWMNYLDATAALHAYPYSHEIYPPAICPLREIISQKLNQVDFTLQPISETALADQGIPVVSIQSYPIPDQERPASFLLIGADTLYVLGYVPTREGWDWRLMTSFYSKTSSPQAFFQDVTNDGFPELAYFQQNQNWYCLENQEAYEIFLTTSAGNGFVSLGRTVCHSEDQIFKITDYLPDEDRDGVVDWVTDQIREYAGDSFLTAERDTPATWFTPDEIRSMIPEQNIGEEAKADLISELYDSKNASIVRQKLIEERDALDPDDPMGEWAWQRLTYLIAVSYEVDSQTEAAVEMFASILQSKHQTLWGNVAELHLKPE